MPAAAAPIAAGIGGIGSILGGVKGSSAASGASAAQVAAAQQAEKYIQGLLQQYNPAIGTAAQQAADLATQAGTGAAGQMQTTLAQNQANVQGGVGQANALLDPYAQLGTQAAGQLASLMAPGGALTQQFGVQQMQQNDPGYQFRIDQANKALQASAAARGGALGGGVLRALDTQTQNLASSEMQNAFNRWNTQQQNLYNRLTGMVGTGMGAAGQQAGNITGANQFLANQGMTGALNIGQWMVQPAEFAGTALTGGAATQASNAMTAAQAISNLITGQGNAQAAGIMGGANAWANALGGITNAAGGLSKYYQDKSLLDLLLKS